MFGLGEEEHHGNIYIIDRGLQSTRVIDEFDKKSVKFIIRAKENRKFEEITPSLDAHSTPKWDGWEVVKDSKVKLYTGKPIQNKKGNTHTTVKKWWKTSFVW